MYAGRPYHSADAMRFHSLLSLGLITFAVACAAKGTSTGDPNAGTKTPPKDEGSSSVPSEDDNVPHALGTITLGESRSSATGDSSPVITASFLPDSSLKQSCTRKIGACEMAETPQCRTGTTEGCRSGEVCAFDNDCQATCIKACTKACGAGETCAFVSASASEDGDGMTCKKKDRFDAGAIAFSGTTTAITLFPPYAITPEGNGAPFMARSEVHVQASGAAASGFEKFDEKFTTTTFLETNPPLRDLDKATVFGRDDLVIGWVAGEDHVLITATGPFGSAKCEANDADGEYALSREVINEVMGSSAGSSGNFSLTVTRERREVRRDKKAIGAPHEKGFLELVTTSSETHSFQACSTGYAMCGAQCVNLQSDRYNCGTCGKVCPSTQYCSSGYCY
jgi:hypothetical protein